MPSRFKNLTMGHPPEFFQAEDLFATRPATAKLFLENAAICQ